MCSICEGEHLTMMKKETSDIGKKTENLQEMKDIIKLKKNPSENRK